jgi:hypothetical protein
MVLKFMWQKWFLRVSTGLILCRKQLAGSYEHGNEPSGSAEGRICVDLLS